MAHRSLGKVFTVVLALAGLTWLALGAGMTFFADEWAFIAGRSLADPTDWFRPHNEHWSTLPIVAYRLLVETIGIGSYVPYQALVVLLHLLVAAMVYRLVERRSGPRAALLSGTLVAFLPARRRAPDGRTALTAGEDRPRREPTATGAGGGPSSPSSTSGGSRAATCGA